MSYSYNTTALHLYVSGDSLGWRESKGYAGWRDSKRLKAATLQLATLFQSLKIHLVEKQKCTHIIRRVKFSEI